MLISSYVITLGIFFRLILATEVEGDLTDLLSAINEESPLVIYADIFPFGFRANGLKGLDDLSETSLSFLSSSMIFSLNYCNSLTISSVSSLTSLSSSFTCTFY